MKYTGRKFHKHSKGLNLIKIGLKIKIQNFGCWSHFDPLYILETVRAIVSILYKENFIMNIKKKTSLRLVETLTLHIQKKKKKKIFFYTFGSLKLVSLVYFWWTKKNQKFNQHSCQVWFQLANWFQRRRLKCNSFQTTKTHTKWWQYLTKDSHDPFGSRELKIVRYIKHFLIIGRIIT